MFCKIGCFSLFQQWKNQHLDIQLPPEAEDQLNIFGSGNVPMKQEKNGTRGFGKGQAILTAAEMQDEFQSTLHHPNPRPHVASGECTKQGLPTTWLVA